MIPAKKQTKKTVNKLIGDREVIMLFTFTRMLSIVTKHRILAQKSAMEIVVTRSKSQKSMYNGASSVLNSYFYM